VGAFLAASALAAVMNESDVVFMYAAEDSARYGDYQANWAAWGLPWSMPSEKAVKIMRRKGVHSVGARWCLTAGARRLKEDPSLAEAVCRDIEGMPIVVPWLKEQTYEGTPPWFGCTNNPRFREFVRSEVAEALAARPDGLHIDDPKGTFATVEWGGGCFCDHCMEAFRKYLVVRETPGLLKEAGAGNFRDFDYRELVRKYAKTRQSYLGIQDKLPLREEFLDCQLRLRYEHLHEIREMARQMCGPAATFSINAYFSEPASTFTALVPLATHIVCEVDHRANEGTRKLLSVVTAYRQAEALGRPLAATAGGHDYAWVKAHDSVNLVRIWIALSYACGSRLMVPHPEHQWCHTEEMGTHWYAAPVKPFAPMYRFVRRNPALFDGFRAVGPLAPPPGLPDEFMTGDSRRKLKEALDTGGVPLEAAGGRAWAFPRAHPDGRLAVHVVNLDYSSGDTVNALKNFEVAIPVSLAPERLRKITLYRFDGFARGLKARREGESLVLAVPELPLWGVILLDP